MEKTKRKINAKKKWRKVRAKFAPTTPPRRLISDPIRHKYWERAFSQALRHPKLAYQDGLTDASLTISLDEQHHRVVKKRQFKIEVEFQSGTQSSFQIFELIGD